MNEELFARAKAGEPRAVAALVALLRPRLTRMARYYARRTGENADDLLQDAWVGLLEALPEMDVRIGSPEHFLAQRARWRLLDAVKRASLRRCAPLEEALWPSAGGDLTEAVLAALCIAKFASRLKSTQQAILSCLMSGLTWREARMLWDAARPTSRTMSARFSGSMRRGRRRPFSSGAQSDDRRGRRLTEYAPWERRVISS